MITSKQFLYASFLIAFGALSLQAWAYDLNKDWRIHGFLAQAAIYTDDNNYFGPSDDDISTEFFEAGLALNGSLFSDSLRFSTQLLARDAGANDDGSPSFDYTFLSYDIVNNAQWRTGLRLGRIPSQMGLYNATRDVPFTRPGILLPQSIYGETVRNSRFAHDGLQWYGTWNFDLDRIIWRLDYYRPLSDGSETDDIFLVPLPGDIDSEDSWMAQVIYEWDGGTGKIGLTYELWKNTYQLTGYDLFEFANSFQYDPAVEALDLPTKLRDQHVPEIIVSLISDELSRTDIPISERIENIDASIPNVDVTALVNSFLPTINLKGDIDIASSLLSAEYNWQQLTFTAEYMVRRIVNKKFETAFLNKTIEQEAYFVQTVYHAANRWDLIIRHDRFYYDKEDLSGQDFRKNLPSMPQHRAFAFDTTLGVSYHHNSRFMGRLEWHHVKGTIWLPINDNPEILLTKKYWNMVALQAAYRF